VSVLSLDSREVERVATNIEWRLSQMGGRLLKPQIKALLPNDDHKYLGQAYRHLENNGKVTIAGWRVSLGRAA
jgi:hypothetical protein